MMKNITSNASIIRTTPAPLSPTTARAISSNTPTATAIPATWKLTKYKDANGHSTLFQYDDLAAPSAIAFADGTTFNFKYTDDGALEKFLAGNTHVADYEVDRTTGSWKVSYTDGDHAQFVVRNGMIVQAMNDAGTVDLAYDENGCLIKETFQNSTVTYHRNETGKLLGVIYQNTIRVFAKLTVVEYRSIFRVLPN